MLLLYIFFFRSILLNTECDLFENIIFFNGFDQYLSVTINPFFLLKRKVRRHKKNAWVLKPSFLSQNSNKILSVFASIFILMQKIAAKTAQNIIFSKRFQSFLILYTNWSVTAVNNTISCKLF